MDIHDVDSCRAPCNAIFTSGDGLAFFDLNHTVFASLREVFFYTDANAGIVMGGWG